MFTTPNIVAFLGFVLHASRHGDNLFTSQSILEGIVIFVAIVAVQLIWDYPNFQKQRQEAALRNQELSREEELHQAMLERIKTAPVLMTPNKE